MICLSRLWYMLEVFKKEVKAVHEGLEVGAWHLQLQGSKAAAHGTARQSLDGGGLWGQRVTLT